MANLEKLIEETVAAAKTYRDSDHFMLEYRDGVWRAEAVPMFAAAMTGELRFAFKGTGPTPEAAVGMLLSSLGATAPRQSPQLP